VMGATQPPIPCPIEGCLVISAMLSSRHFSKTYPRKEGLPGGPGRSHRRQTRSAGGREWITAYSRAMRSPSRENRSRPLPQAARAVAAVSRRLPPSDIAILCCSGSVTCVMPRPIGCSSLPSLGWCGICRTRPCGSALPQACGLSPSSSLDRWRGSSPTASIGGNWCW
jgi:hypothetical protein